MQQSLPGFGGEPKVFRVPRVVLEVPPVRQSAWLRGLELSDWIEKNPVYARAFFVTSTPVQYSFSEIRMARCLLNSGACPSVENADAAVAAPAACEEEATAASAFAKRLGNPALNADTFPKNSTSWKSGDSNA